MSRDPSALDSGGSPKPLTPYYQDEFVTLYNCAWQEIAGLARGADLVLADPPYGIGLNTAYAARKRTALSQSNDYPPIAGDDTPFEPAPLLQWPNVVLWGANYYADKLPPRGSWLVWDKIAGLTSVREQGFNDGADCELAWVDGVNGTVPRMFRHRWAGMLKASEQDQRRVHPSQKPVALMGWCLSFFPDARLVFDPFCGSGPVPRACKDRGIHCIAAELSEDYCAVTAERLSQNVLDFSVA